MRFLSVGIFHQIGPPGPGLFWFLPKIHGDIWIWNRFCSVRYTAESIKKRPLKKILSSYSPFYMIKVWSSGLVFWRVVPLRAVVAFICLSMAYPVYLTPRKWFQIQISPRSLGIRRSYFRKKPALKNLMTLSLSVTIRDKQRLTTFLTPLSHWLSGRKIWLRLNSESLVEATNYWLSGESQNIILIQRRKIH